MSKKNKSYVCEGAKLRCRFGDQESTLKVPMRFVQVDGKGQAVVSDSVANKNIFPFGRCKPRKCPCTPAPAPKGWILYEESVLISAGLGYKDALLESSILTCKNGGAISIVDSGCKAHTKGAQGILSNLKNEEKEKKNTAAAIKKADNERNKNKAEDKKIDKAKSEAGKTKEDADEDIAEKIAKYARENLVGYEYGHKRVVNFEEEPDKLDCSELVARAYYSEGIKIPTYTDWQYIHCQKNGQIIKDIKAVNLADLMFINTKSTPFDEKKLDVKGNGPSATSHVVLVTKVYGDGNIEITSAHEPGRESDTSKKINISTNQYYIKNFIGYGRIVK